MSTFTRTFRRFGFTAIFIAVTASVWSSAHAHDPLLDLPEPTSAPEAWDIIRQSVDNVATLLETNQLKPIALHIANCSTAIRRLQAGLTAEQQQAGLHDKLQSMFTAGGAVITATRQKESPHAKAQAQYLIYRALWDEIAERYPPAVRMAAVYNCPMHPLDRHLKDTDRCTICSMKLYRRRIPSSATYEKPGDPSMKLTLVADPPLKVGVRSAIKAKLARNDGSPVVPGDLLVMHTERVHLLIVDQSLSDYHHEHPTPTKTPGEYAFAITPRRPGPYRIFADVVPGATGIQEYVGGDIPAADDNCHGDEIADRADRAAGADRGLSGEVSLEGWGKRPLRAGEVIAGEVRFTGPDGKPFSSLEPVMGAFAHLVGFADDRKTVVHIHPQGQEPTTDDARGGPVLRFNFYAPRPGYYRLYVQVAVHGQQRFIPVGVNVAPAGK